MGKLISVRIVNEVKEEMSIEEHIFLISLHSHVDIFFVFLSVCQTTFELKVEILLLLMPVRFAIGESYWWM